MENYYLLEQIGKGSYGVVLKIKEKNTNNIYALKKIKINNFSRKYEIKYLLNELKILYFHNCEYLLKCRDIIYQNKYLNIITDHAKYSDLNNYIDRYKRKNKFIPEDRIWLIFIKCCYGIQYLHEFNIIHRDLKPGNILLDVDQKIYLADFGISKILEKKVNSYTMIGTPYYISPEMYNDKSYDKKIDIWALGCILYELVTLSVPFKANDLKALKYKIISGNYYKHNLGIYSSDIKNMIRLLLEKNVKDRLSIDDIIDSRIFKKKEKELGLFNSNNFTYSLNDKFQDSYKAFDKSSNWNKIIKKLKKSKSSDSIDKLEIIRSKEITSQEVENCQNYINKDLPKINLPKINLPKINSKDIVQKDIIQKDIISKDIVQKDIVQKDINEIEDFNESKINFYNQIYKKNLPKLDLKNKNNNYYNNINKNKNVKYNYNYQNIDNYMYPKYHANYYKNKYNSNYNIINNSILPKIKFNNNIYY